MSRGGSKVLTAVISFFLGFLFAILVEIGAVFGVYWVVMNKDLESIMNAVGIHNTDEEGNHRYINTDPDTGVTTLKELISGLQGLIYVNGEVVALGKSFDDFSQLVPATDMLLEFVYKNIDGYIDLDKELFESTPLSGLAQVLSDSILDVRTAALMQKLDIKAIMGEDANGVVKSLVLGAETEYATVKMPQSTAVEGEEGETSVFRLPVLYDYYMYVEEEDRYVRTTDYASAFPDNLSGRKDVLYNEERKNGDGKVISTHTLYYVPCRVTETGIEEAEYITDEISVTEGTGDAQKTYRFQILSYGEDTDFIAVKPNADGEYILDYTAIYAALNANAANRSYRFTGYSYDQNYARKYYEDPKKDEGADRYVFKTISGKNYFRDNAGNFVQLNPLTLRDIANDPYAPLDSVLLSDLAGDNGDIAYKVFGKTTLGAFMRGEVDFEAILNDVEAGALVSKVSPSNKIMSYIVYKVSDLKPAGNGEYTGIYDRYGENKPVSVTVEDGYISGVYELNNADVEIPGVKMSEISKLANEMPITIIMDIRADEAVTAYLGYGVYGMKAAADGATDPLGNPYSYTATVKVGEAETPCYVSTEKVNGEGGVVEHITSVWYISDGVKTEVRGTKVSEVSSRVDTFTDDLTIGEVLNIDTTDNMLLSAIKDSKIGSLDTRLDELTVGEIISDEDLNKSTMLSQLKGAKIKNLADEVDRVLIQRVYAEEVYGLNKGEELTPKQATEWHEDRLYYVFDSATGAYRLDDTQAKAAQEAAAEEDKETAYDDALGHITKEQFDNGTFYTFGEAKGMWRLILYKNVNGKDVEKAYTMNNFNNMIACSTQNINNATLGTLQAAGIVDKTADLTKKLNVGGTDYVLSDMTLKDIINYVVSVSAS